MGYNIIFDLLMKITLPLMALVALTKANTSEGALSETAIGLARQIANGEEF